MRNPFDPATTMVAIAIAPGVCFIDVTGLPNGGAKEESVRGVIKEIGWRYCPIQKKWLGRKPGQPLPVPVWWVVKRMEGCMDPPPKIG